MSGQLGERTGCDRGHDVVRQPDHDRFNVGTYGDRLLTALEMRVQANESMDIGTSDRRRDIAAVASMGNKRCVQIVITQMQAQFVESTELRQLVGEAGVGWFEGEKGLGYGRPPAHKPVDDFRALCVDALRKGRLLQFNGSKIMVD